MQTTPDMQAHMGRQEKDDKKNAPNSRVWWWEVSQQIAFGLQKQRNKKAPILTELTSVSFGKEAQQKTLETFQFLQTQLSPFKLAS